MLKIRKIHDSIVVLDGKYKYKQGMLFDLSKDVKGYLISAKEDEASLLIIGDPSLISKNTNVKISKEKITNVKIYSNFFGSIISPFGNILETNSKLVSKLLGKRKLDNTSPNILDRVKLTDPLLSGMISIDTMIPIGRGQRELIIGDRSTGKSTIAINTIINQKNNDVKSIYVAIGQKRNSVINIYKTLKKHGVSKNTIMIFASPDSSSEQFFAPKIGMTIAEFLAYQGKDVLIIMDDLTKHANIYREIALSIGKNPGREAYPTNIFYEHSRLLERSGRFNEKYNNGSITCLPIVETIQGDVASTIPSNTISITDGQIFTSSQMANNSEFPAIDIGSSVSRTGSLVQNDRIKNFSKGLKAFYLELYDVKKFADMSIDISEELKKQINNWFGINNLLIQYGSKGYVPEQMEILITMFRMKLLHKIIEKSDFSIAFNNYCQNNYAAKKVIEMIKLGELDDYEKLKEAIKIVFSPLAKIASNIKNGVISEKEYLNMKGINNDR